MSTTTSDTEAIDDKKDTTPTTSPFSGTFMATMFSKLLLLGIIVVTGTCMVYTCRVAQSNILPTDLNLYPYTDNMPIINNGEGDILINIDVVKTSKGIFATLIKFPLAENMESLKFGLFGYLKNMIESKDAGNFQLYAATTIQQLLATNLAIINWIFNLYNSYFTESMIIFIVPFLLIFINFFTGIVNSFYLMFLWFYNLPLLFYVPSRKDSRTSWTKGNMWSIVNWWKSIFWIFIFILLFFILGIGLIIPILAGSITMYSILSPLFMTARKADDPNKKYTLMDTFMNIIEYKLSVIMYIVSYFVISDAYSSYGSYSALVAIIACLLLYFFTDIYKQYIPEIKTPWNSDYKQAAKNSHYTGEAVVINDNEEGKTFSNVNGSLPSAPPKMINLNNHLPSAHVPPSADNKPVAESQQQGAELQQEPALEPLQTSGPPGGEIELQNLNQPLEIKPNKKPTQFGPSRIPPADPNIDNSIGNDQLGGRIKKRHSRKNVKL